MSWCTSQGLDHPELRRQLTAIIIGSENIVCRSPTLLPATLHPETAPGGYRDRKPWHQ